MNIVWNKRLIEACDFFRQAHESIGQKRRYTGEPYFNHCLEVAESVSEIGGTEDMIIAAFGHDTLEDVFPVKPQYDAYLIAREFGETVVKFVVDLTDVYTKEAWPDLNRAKRKALEVERLARTSPEAKTIKLADLLSNTKSIVAHDPDFAKVYLKEKLAMLPHLADGSPILLQLASTQVIAGFASLGLKIPTLHA